MNFRQQIGLSAATDTKESSDAQLWKEFGILGNPFPSAHQTAGHPRSLEKVDNTVLEQLKHFFATGNSETVMIEGTQGTGKTNLLNHYQDELSALAAEEEGFYVVRYYANPEPKLDELLRQIVQELGVDHLKTLAIKLIALGDTESDKAMAAARNPDFRTMAKRLSRMEADSENLDYACVCALEWLTGLRVLKRHTENIGVYFRLDTTEARLQGLHDLVILSGNLGVLKGIFLLLDELEKQDDLTPSTANIVRYLSSLRALIDALPRYRFLMLAITPSARGNYFRLYPALASRLQGNILTLQGLENFNEARKLYTLYLTTERKRSLKIKGDDVSQAGEKDLFQTKRLDELFSLALHNAQKRSEILTPRTWLDYLHRESEELIKHNPAG